MFCVPLKSNLSFAQISKNKSTNPSPYLHADDHLPSKKHLPQRPRTPEPTVVPATTVIPESTIIPTAPVTPATTIILATAHIPPMYPTSKKRLLIRVDVEEGRVVSESSHYTED